MMKMMKETNFTKDL